MKERLKNLLCRDLSVRALLLLGLGFTLAKLILTSFQLVLATPDFAILDDTLMYEAAKSITEGQWLGEYNWLTLGKYMLFPVWLAMLHTLHIPYLLGGQLLQMLASLAGAWALAPLIRRRWGLLLCYVVLFYNPAASAAYVALRIYRDSITPALSLLLFAGFIGYALRWRQPLRKSVWFLLIGGIGLACSYLNREDGIWFLPFAIIAGLVTAGFLLWDKGICQRMAKLICLLIPYLILGGGILAFCLVNQHYYGRFVLSDFTSSEFKDAYGALTRVTQKDPQNKVPVPYETRMRIYDAVEEFAFLEPYLETDMMYNNFGSVPDKEFFAGGFYWALRSAAQDAGIYQDASTAEAYFRSLADAVNAACDSGLLEAGPPRSGTTPAIRAEHILPTIKETFLNLGRVLSFSQADPYYKTTLSTQLNGQPELREEYEDFLGCGVNWIAKAGTDEPYYSPIQQMSYLALNIIRYLFAVLVPIWFAVVLVCQVLKTRRCFGREGSSLLRLCWIIELGLLCCLLLRCAIVAFMSVAAFNDVEDIMYLSSAHPILLLYLLIGSFTFLFSPLKRLKSE